MHVTKTHSFTIQEAKKDGDVSVREESVKQCYIVFQTGISKSEESQTFFVKVKLYGLLCSINFGFLIFWLIASFRRSAYLTIRKR